MNCFVCLGSDLLLGSDGDKTAWTYLYNQVPDASARIPHGDWRRWLSERGE